MTSRNHPDFISAYLDYASHGEAPRHMHFWASVSAVAGALQRKVWMDMAYFKWYPNFFIILVAPPGVVSKSTTAGIAMDILREVPGVRFGPDVVTWPALISAFSDSTVSFSHEGTHHLMSSMTLASSEFGNLVKPNDMEMIDLLISLWDGKQGSFEKKTKGSGNDSIPNPWVNLIGCTTPSWIAGNFPEHMIGGGFTSRCVFVYADTKEKLVAYPSRHVPEGLAQRKALLVEDLTRISLLTGEYRLTEEAYVWGEAWYRRHYDVRPENLNQEQFLGYLARKQTHLHKLAMVLAASSSDSLEITKENLETADLMLTDLEPDMRFVFSKLGRSDISLHTEKLVSFVHSMQSVGYATAYRHVHAFFPSMRDFEDVLAGCVKAGFVKISLGGPEVTLTAGLPLPVPTGVPKRTDPRGF
jgi:Protein of unknown function (DUF3987)